MKSILALIFVFNFYTLNAQLETSDWLNPTQIFQDMLLGYASSVSNVTYTGLDYSRGTFNGMNTTLGIDQGVILTTGTILDDENGPHGPNDQPSAGYDNWEQGYLPLTNLIGSTTYNAAVLECDFVATSDTVKIEYIFGSDEYPEFVGTQFNDGFAFLISGPGISDTVNMALIPNVSLPVSINNVNNGTSNNGPCSFCVYYVDNGNGTNTPYDSNEEYIQYDGYTAPLTAFSLVQPGETYHLVIAIADVGDGIYDSGLFIKTSNSQSSLDSHQNSKQIKIYPNPNRGSFVLENITEKDIRTIDVIGADGRALNFNLDQLNDKAEFNIGLEDASPGVYWIKIITEEGAFHTEKFVVE